MLAGKLLRPAALGRRVDLYEDGGFIIPALRKASVQGQFDGIRHRGPTVTHATPCSQTSPHHEIGSYARHHAYPSLFSQLLRCSSAGC